MKVMLTNIVSACMLNFAKDVFYVNAVAYVLVNEPRCISVYRIHTLFGRV